MRGRRGRGRRRRRRRRERKIDWNSALIVNSYLPGPARGIVLPDSGPLPLTQVRPPSLPVGYPVLVLGQSV